MKYEDSVKLTSTCFVSDGLIMQKIGREGPDWMFLAPGMPEYSSGPGGLSGRQVKELRGQCAAQICWLWPKWTQQAEYWQGEV